MGTVLLLMMPAQIFRRSPFFRVEVKEKPPHEEAPPINPLTLYPSPAYVRKARFTPSSFYDRIAAKIDPEALQKYSTSYTYEDLREGSGEDASFSLNSAWFFSDSSKPQAGVRMQKNPMSGEYELSGGELFIPGSGVGMSYERDIESGETRTFLNVKKSF